MFRCWGSKQLDTQFVILQTREVLYFLSINWRKYLLISFNNGSTVLVVLWSTKYTVYRNCNFANKDSCVYKAVQPWKFCDTQAVPLAFYVVPISTLLSQSNKTEWPSASGIFTHAELCLHSAGATWTTDTVALSSQNIYNHLSAITTVKPFLYE